ncbi:DmsC/YnfH family molybdoenzyme membrane anchor subunit [Candidatus Aalborgicola defluviihabitans]|uniref:DmsC/YnfH family molybdoenzyme membrane anchor subunit n=1 Tax=Candidatus Aalborgicola defluviihabitans TaxID=3386187 RepID=UPI001DC0F284|nr:dimethyl sulfoxide reductase anchor subunit [Burkholderiales bacterium]MBK7314698.1 dimethyl sulfoxide reductase anchor subunit [Burkholderiales bacterium]
MKSESFFKARHQTNWDWRAAGNFICGGSGCSLLIFAAVFSGAEVAYRPFGISGLLLIALGLFSVALEIGRPFRSLNVFRHVHTSWMTREAMVAGPLFMCGAMAVWTGSALWIWLTALLAFSFLYCQARMVYAAKGVPAWRARRTGPLFFVTGLTEGAGLLVLGAVLLGARSPVTGVVVVLALLIIARALLWRSYRAELGDSAAPKQTLAALDSIDFAFVKIGHWVALALLLLSLAMPSMGGAWLAAAAGLLAASGGWLLKYTVIVPAAFLQGYALPRLPVRGRGVPVQRQGAKL